MAKKKTELNNTQKQDTINSDQTPPQPSKGDIQAGSSETQATPPTIANIDLINSILDGYSSEGTDQQKAKARQYVRQYLKQQIDGHTIAAQYNVCFLYDNSTMVQSDADNIYTAVTKFAQKRPILLVLHSSGGSIEPAYLIGKLLNEYSDGRLEVVVPRRAKSAATLLCCAAEHVHMGSMSELGPIDPQINSLPALGLKSAIQHIAALIGEHPEATELFSKYMNLSIKPIDLGYYERVAESAAQYAERLLNLHKDSFGQVPKKMASDLVYSYKDHAFVIDKDEAQMVFGNTFVKLNSEEYAFGNAVYQSLNFVSTIANIRDCNFYMIGSLDTEPVFVQRRKRL